MPVGSIVAFVVTDLVIWWLGTVKAKRSRRRRGGLDVGVYPLGFIVGSDDRLSLSRLQAFLWTMVIFGTYAAAWWGHQPVRWFAREEVAQHADTVAVRARETAMQAHTLSIQSTVQARVLASQADEAAARPLPATPAAADSARALVAQLRAQQVAAVAAARRASDAEEVSAATADALEEDAARYKWVAIPAALLALAGISIGSGVFSTLIAAGKSSGITPCVTSFSAVPYPSLATRFTSLGVPREPNAICALIQGAGFGSSGRVRLDGDYIDILYWADDGRTIVIVPPATAWSGTLIVDTGNGKAAYGTSGHPSTFDATRGTATLGPATAALEWSDLFRSDSDPTNFDLMKFQMFGWTLIGVALYLWNFFAVIAQHPLVSTLPALDPSLVTLTGVSQAAYLANKGAKPSSDRGGVAAAPPAPAPAPVDGQPGLIPPLPAPAP